MTALDQSFAALADPTRRAIIARLAAGEATVQDLARPFSISQPAISRHLKVLEEAGLVEVRRQGRSSNYRLNRSRLEQVVGGWMRHLQPVGPEQRWSSSGPKSTAALAERTPSGSRHSSNDSQRRDMKR